MDGWHSDIRCRKFAEIFGMSPTVMVFLTSHIASGRFSRLRTTGYAETRFRNGSSIEGIDRIINGAALMVALISVLTLGLILG